MLLITSMTKDQSDRREIKAYVESRGKAPVPRSWRGKIGDGI